MLILVVLFVHSILNFSQCVYKTQKVLCMWFIIYCTGLNYIEEFKAQNLTRTELLMSLLLIRKTVYVYNILVYFCCFNRHMQSKREYNSLLVKLHLAKCGAKSFRAKLLVLDQSLTSLEDSFEVMI